MTEPIYLDNAATTPVLPEVRDAMLPFLGSEGFGNPSSAHRYGRAARAAVEAARRQVADAVGADPSAVIFTSGGTEADNLAVLGGALSARAGGRPFRVAVSTIEHKAVLGAAAAVEALGGEVLHLPVDQHGMVEPESLDRALESEVAVVSIMWVNNEVGTMQNLPALAQPCAETGTWFHSDAVQALGKTRCGLDGFPPLTMLSVSAHKIGGPKGVGALILPDHGAVVPLIHGGGQQWGIRPGTENIAGIVGMGRAAELAVAKREATAEQVRRLRDAFELQLEELLPDVRVNGSGAPRAPHISNISVPGTDSETMLMHLDLAGICCASGSACTTGSIEPSHVLTAMGVPDDLATASLRFSFARSNTREDVAQVAKLLPAVVEKVRNLGKALRR